MNAKWMNHLLAYRDSPYRMRAACALIRQKIVRQAALAARYNHPFSVPPIFSETDAGKLLLLEARYARMYWRMISRAIPPWCAWNGRIPHGNDIANRLLDIGYHSLAGVIQKKCEALDIPVEVGLLHTAQSAKAQPLIYDFMECFRVLMVDEVLMRFLRMKKRPLKNVDQELIQDFLHEAYRALHREYYHRGRRACIRLSYWIDLVLLEFRNAVSEHREFDPHWMPVRHENRCNKKPPHVAGV